MLPDEALDQVGHHPTLRGLMQEEIEVPELQQLPIVPPQITPNDFRTTTTSSFTFV